MFLKNKYHNWYLALVETRKFLTRDGYAEKHHIIPVSLGGSNNHENIVALTAREHFVAHLLLVFCTDGVNRKKMLKAFTMMKAKSKNQERHNPTNSRIYAKLKHEANRARMEYKHSPEAINAIREFQKGKPKAPFTDDHKRKLSESKRGNQPWNKGLCGAKASAETKRKMSDTRRKNPRKLSTEEKLELANRSRLYIACFDKLLMKNVYVLRSEFKSAKEKYITHRSNEYKQLKESNVTSNSL